MLAALEQSDGSKSVTPLDRLPRYSLEQQLAEDATVDLGTGLPEVNVRALGHLAVEDWYAVLTAEPLILNVPRARVPDELVLEPVLAQGPLATVPFEIEHAAEVRAGVAAGFALVESSRNASLVDRKSTRLNSSHSGESRMPSSA